MNCACSNETMFTELWVAEEPPSCRTEKMTEIDQESLQQAIEIVKDAKKVAVFSGAGISVASGIPDFRCVLSFLFLFSRFSDLGSKDQKEGSGKSTTQL